MTVLQSEPSKSKLLQCVCQSCGSDYYIVNDKPNINMEGTAYSCPFCGAWYVLPATRVTFQSLEDRLA